MARSARRRLNLAVQNDEAARSFAPLRPGVRGNGVGTSERKSVSI
jgi:hypothetical protein